MVYVVSQKDFETLSYSIFFLRLNSINKIDNIYIVAKLNSVIIDFCKKNRLIFIDEDSVCEIKLKDIKYFYNNLDRSGWLFQQILKLNIHKIITNRYYLVLDSDTILTKKKIFLDQNNIYLSVADWIHEPYFAFIKKALKLDIENKISFVVHYMLFDKEILMDLETRTLELNKITLNELILKETDYNSISGFSEYELYGQFLYKYYKKSINLKNINNIPLKRNKLNWLTLFYYKYFKNFDFVSFHSHLN